MGSLNARDLLTSFSPDLDLFAISSGDGRIKIWDTGKEQLQIEFTDITSTDETNLYMKPERGHLSVDYTCMKWVYMDRKKKRKHGLSFLVLGTGSGDVLALDVSAGQLKWRVTDCHPGGVSAISFSSKASCIYTAGADGMVCQIDSLAGNVLRKFKASTKAVSSMSISSDGKVLATAAGRMKLFSCSDYKKIQKFSGHPGAVHSMMFTEDGKYILSSGIGERYVAVWRIDGSKKQAASCVLAMEHPAVTLDCKCSVDDEALSVLAVSEVGLCYLWHGKNIEELRKSEPTKISLSIEEAKNQKGILPIIFAAKLQGITKPSARNIFVAHGLLIKPSFEKILVHYGEDVTLKSSRHGVLLPISQSHQSKKGQDARSGVTVLDRSNVEDAVFPIPKILDPHDLRKRYQKSSIDPDELITDQMVNSRSLAKSMENKVGRGTTTVSMVDQLRSKGILCNKDDFTFNSVLNSTIFKGIAVEANMARKKMAAAVLPLAPSDAHKLLTLLVDMWQSGSLSGKFVCPWLCCILVNHGHHVISQEILDSLHNMAKPKGLAFQSLLQSVGRLQLVTSQIDKASRKTEILADNHHEDGGEDEEEEEDADEVLFGEESESEDSSGVDE